GGYGTVLKYKNHRKELSEGFRMATNNRMELLAVIKGLEELKLEGIPVTIYADRKDVVDAVTTGWLGNWPKKGLTEQKSVDLWKRYIPLHLKYKPRFVWVRGHAGNVENECCDRLAVAAAESDGLQADRGYEAEMSRGNI